MATRKKQQGSNWIGLALLGALGFGIYQFGIVGQQTEAPRTATRPAQSAPATSSAPTMAPLSQPRYVNVASLNVRHTPSTSGPLIMTLPRGTPIKALARQDGWLLIDINPTLEGWVSEQLTTIEAPKQRPAPPAGLKSTR